MQDWVVRPSAMPSMPAALQLGSMLSLGTSAATVMRLVPSARAAKGIMCGIPSGAASGAPCITITQIGRREFPQKRAAGGEAPSIIAQPPDPPPTSRFRWNPTRFTPGVVVIHSPGAFRLSFPPMVPLSSPSFARSRRMLDPFVYTSDRLRVLFGSGAIARIAAEAEHHKMTRVMLLASRNRGGLARGIAARLGARAVGICDAVRPGMPGAAFDAIVAELERLCADGFVCIGGGSPTGLAKAVAAAIRIPFIAVVTTYSGSEMSSRWYIGAGADERSGASPAALPASAIYDPDLTLDLPFATSAASCMNAMAHAVESLYGPDGN